MQIELANGKLKKTFESARELTGKYGAETAEVIQIERQEEGSLSLRPVRAVCHSMRRRGRISREQYSQVFGQVTGQQAVGQGGIMSGNEFRWR